MCQDDQIDSEVGRMRWLRAPVKGGPWGGIMCGYIKISVVLIM